MQTDTRNATNENKPTQRSAQGGAMSAARSSALVLFDQVLVSATNFATAILLGRAASQGVLGEYTLAFWLVLTFVAIQEALTVLPYTVFLHRLSKEGSARKDYAGSCMLQVTLLATAVALFFVIAAILSQFYELSLPTSAFCALAIAGPFWLFRQHLRRFALAHFDTKGTIQIDISASLIQIVGLALLFFSEQLTATNVFVVMAIACGMGSYVGWIRQRQRMAFNQLNLKQETQKNWTFGKWILLSRVSAALRPLIIIVLLTRSHGKGVADVLAACLMVAVQLANPLILGLSNFLAPKASLIVAEKAHHARRLTVQASLVVLLLLIPYCLILLFAGNELAGFIFSSKYGDVSKSISIMVPLLLATALTMVLDQALRAANRPRQVAYAQTFGLLITLVLGWFLVGQYKVIGAAISLMGGQVVSFVFCMAAFIYYTRGITNDTNISFRTFSPGTKSNSSSANL